MPVQSMAQPDGGADVFFLAIGPASRTAELEYRAERDGRRARHIRGGKCATIPAAYDEFAAACQFPVHFGGNGDAFIDAATSVFDLDDDLGRNPAGLDLILVDAARFLPGAALGFFVRLLNIVADELREPSGAVAGRPARSRTLRVYLHFEQPPGAGELARWRAAGAAPLAAVALT